MREMLEKLRRSAARRARAVRPRRRLRRHRPGAARRRRHRARRRSTSSRSEARESGDQRRQEITDAGRRTSATLQLDMLPPDLAGQVRELQQYDFTSTRGARAVRGAHRQAAPAAHAELLQPDGRRDAATSRPRTCSG